MIPLLILGLLKERPGSYGYELLTLMNERHYKFVVNYTKGSFYYNIQQLEEKNWIRRLPALYSTDVREKNQYTLTEKGLDEFNRLILKYGTKTDYINLSFYSAMLFQDEVEPQVMKDLIHSQIKQTEKKIFLIESALVQNTALLKNFVRMLENSIAHHKVNLEWFHNLLSELESSI